MSTQQPDQDIQRAPQRAATLSDAMAVARDDVLTALGSDHLGIHAAAALAQLGQLGTLTDTKTARHEHWRSLCPADAAPPPTPSHSLTQLQRAATEAGVRSEGTKIKLLERLRPGVPPALYRLYLQSQAGEREAAARAFVAAQGEENLPEYDPDTFISIPVTSRPPFSLPQDLLEGLPSRKGPRTGKLHLSASVVAQLAIIYQGGALDPDDRRAVAERANPTLQRLKRESALQAHLCSALRELCTSLGLPEPPTAINWLYQGGRRVSESLFSAQPPPMELPERAQRRTEQWAARGARAAAARTRSSTRLNPSSSQ